MKFNTKTWERKKTIDCSTINRLPSLHLFSDGKSNNGSYTDIKYLQKFKYSVEENLAIVREMISPSVETINQSCDPLENIPKEFVPGLICLKNRLLEVSKLVLLTAPQVRSTSTDILTYLGKIVAKCERKRILLVDCNLRDPVLHKKFNLPQKDGLTEYLCYKIKLDKIIKKTKFAGIRVITSGAHKASPTNLFTSYAFTHFIQTIKNQFDLVLFDSPPYRKFGDAYILARQISNVLLVLQGEENNWEDIKDIRQELERLGVSLLGLNIKNKSYKYN